LRISWRQTVQSAKAQLFTPIRVIKRASVEYRRLLYIGGFRQSMSRKGNCFDNAQRDQFLFQIQGGAGGKRHL
jgi:hypothetical protein